MKALVQKSEAKNMKETREKSGKNCRLGLMEKSESKLLEMCNIIKTHYITKHVM